jgi:hypothetical protein
MKGDRLPEPIRNELLRRVDWRFLLRQEREPTSISFASGSLARALELVSIRALCDGSEARAADLAVVVNPRRRSLEGARAALRPGGELYAESYVVPPNAPARVRRRLAASGFKDVRCYWPWPWPRRASPQFWLPLDAPAAIDFFLRSRAQEQGRSWRRAVLRVVWRWAARLGLVVPVCAVATKPGGERQEVEEVIRDNWVNWEFGRRPERLSWLLLTGGQRSINKVVGLVFANSERAPRLVVKFARSEFEEDGLRREAATLRVLRDRRPELRSVPRVLFLGHRCGRVCLGETAVDGTPLMLRLNHETYAEVATRVTGWLADLAGSPDRQPRTLWWPRLVEERLREFEETFGLVAGQAELEQARAAVSELGDLPLVCEHRDCSPWNILLTAEKELALVDWESSEPRGLPALDLVYFLTYGAFFVEGALASRRTREAYVRTLDPGTFTGSIARSCERSYCERVGLDSELLGPLRLLCWMIHSHSEYGRLELDAAARPDPSALRKSLFLGLWEEELRRAQ